MGKYLALNMKSVTRDFLATGTDCDSLVETITVAFRRQPSLIKLRLLLLPPRFVSGMARTKESLESEIAQLEATLASLQDRRKETEAKLK
jgi:hypothetical protein